MIPARILVVDDEPDIREVLTTLLAQEGYDVITVGDGYAAIEAVQDSPFDLLITDLKIPKMDGIETLRKIKDIQPGILGIVITGYATIETAIEAMKAGAYDYLMKPFNASEVTLLVKRALEYHGLQAENVHLKKSLEGRFRFHNIVGKNGGMRHVCEMIEKVAESDSTILLLGESGTGKELVAKTLHFNSGRRHKPLIPINCGAIPENLLESELFGHEKGAFTGAMTTRIGRFEMADGGTIFLDEIGEMSPSLQVKLLRVLQQREFERVGGARTVRIDVRIIAATHRDLESAVSAGQFREDLFYRLHVIPIHIPPLRDRVEDIPLLIEHFLKHFNKEKNKTLDGFSLEAVRFLMAYAWPGNIRELENLVERIAILRGSGTADVDDLPERMTQTRPLGSSFGHVKIPETGIDLKSLVDEFENSLILQALEKAQGVKNKAAQLLSMNRTTLVEKLKKKGLE